MPTVVFENVPVAEVPEKSRAKLCPTDGALMTLRIKQEVRAASTAAADAFATDDPAFGIWRDGGDVADVAAYVPRISQPHYGRGDLRQQEMKVGFKGCAIAVPCSARDRLEIN